MTRSGKEQARAFEGGNDHIAALEAELEDLRLAVQARDEFLISAAHELRNPITPIVMRLEMLLAAVRAGGAKPDRIASVNPIVSPPARMSRAQRGVGRFSHSSREGETHPFVFRITSDNRYRCGRPAGPNSSCQ